MAPRRQLLTTKLTTGECFDKLRRISDRDEGIALGRSRIPPSPGTLLLDKTPEGFAVRMHMVLPFAPMLQVTMAPLPAPNRGSRLVGRLVLHPHDKVFLIAVAVLAAVFLFGGVRSLLLGLNGSHEIVIGVAIPLAFMLICVLGVWLGRLVIGPDLLETVKEVVEGDEWSAV